VRKESRGSDGEPAAGRRRDEIGQTTVLVIGFATVLVLLVAAVVDASAAYLQRQGLDNLADGAALHGADLGVTGVYHQGLGDRLLQQPGAVRTAVADYLRRARAQQHFPGLTARVSVDPAAGTVTVVLAAPADLPLRIPGRKPARISASGTAAVQVQR
jgi:hypothetical protein